MRQLYTILIELLLHSSAQRDIGHRKAMEFLKNKNEKKQKTKTCQQQNKKSEYFIFNQIIIAKAWGRKKELSDPKSGAVGCVIHRTLKMKTQVCIPLVTKSQE